MDTIDMTRAEKLAYDDAKKEWLADLRNLETGLNVKAYCHDMHHFCTEQRINDFIANLSVVGYRTEKRPLGPLGGARIVIVSFDPVW